jgi:hypothetical protein
VIDYVVTIADHRDMWFEEILAKYLECLRNQAQENLKSHIQVKPPKEYQKCMVGIKQVLKISWDIVHNDSTNNNNRLQALALINDCNKYKMDLTTNGVVITDAIKFVQNSREITKSVLLLLLRRSKIIVARNLMNQIILMMIKMQI